MGGIRRASTDTKDPLASTSARRAPAASSIEVDEGSEPSPSGATNASRRRKAGGAMVRGKAPLPSGFSRSARRAFGAGRGRGLSVVRGSVAGAAVAGAAGAGWAGAGAAGGGAAGGGAGAGAGAGSGAIFGATGAGSGLGWPRATGAVIIAAAVSAPSAPNRRSAPVARVTFLGLAVVPKGQYASAFGPVKWPPARPRGRAGNSRVSLSSSVDCDCSSAALALRQGLRKHVLVRRQRPREGGVGLRERATVTLTRALEPQREGLVGRVDLL